MKKHCVAKVLLAIWEIFLHENNRNYNSYRFSYKFAFILFLSFLTNQKQESGFQQVCGLVKRNTSVFCLKQVALYFKFMPNSTDFYKGIFLHVIAVRMIVPWLYALPSLQVVKKAKTFLSYVKHLWILVGERKCRILTGLYKWAFLNYPTIFLDWHNKTKLVPASFSCFQGFWWKQ